MEQSSVEHGGSGEKEGEPKSGNVLGGLLRGSFGPDVSCCSVERGGTEYDLIEPGGAVQTGFEQGETEQTGVE